MSHHTFDGVAFKIGMDLLVCHAKKRKYHDRRNRLVTMKFFTDFSIIHGEQMMFSNFTLIQLYPPIDIFSFTKPNFQALFHKMQNMLPKIPIRYVI